MLSVSEGRQINTTKHLGGGVNVSAGATLLIKAGALTLSRTQIHTCHILRDTPDIIQVRHTHSSPTKKRWKKSS